MKLDYKFPALAYYGTIRTAQKIIGYTLALSPILCHAHKLLFTCCENTSAVFGWKLICRSS